MRITHSMKPKHFESRALDLLDRMSATERLRLARYLELTGLASNDRGRLAEADDIENAARTEIAAAKRRAA